MRRLAPRALGRRRAMQAGFSAAGLTALGGRPAGAAVRIRPAEDFVESVGVNVHLDSGFYAARFARFRDLLEASRIRHLRDELHPGNNLLRWGELAAAIGVRAHLLVSPVSSTVPQIEEFLEALGPSRVSAIEGQNEGDSDWFKAQPAARGNWSEAVVSFQKGVFRALRSRYPAALLPVLSPSVIDWKPADVALIRPAAPFCDIVSLHSYVQRGEEPETADDYSALHWYLKNMRDGFRPGAPVMATEVGYTNFVAPGGAGVSERASAIYLPRLLLNNFSAGVLRTFLYVFLDGDQSPDDGEQHYGLVRKDGTPKPAFHAIRALLMALGDRGPAVPVEPGGPEFSATLDEASPGARCLTFAKRDGSFVLALWRPERVWDPANAADIDVPAQPLAVTLNRPVGRVDTMVPNDGTAWTGLKVTGDLNISVPVGAKLVLVRLFPSKR